MHLSRSISLLALGLAGSLAAQIPHSDNIVSCTTGSLIYGGPPIAPNPAGLWRIDRETGGAFAITELPATIAPPAPYPALHEPTFVEILSDHRITTTNTININNQIPMYLLTLTNDTIASIETIEIGEAIATDAVITTTKKFHNNNNK